MYLAHNGADGDDAPFALLPKKHCAIARLQAVAVAASAPGVLDLPAIFKILNLVGQPVVSAEEVRVPGKDREGEVWRVDKVFRDDVLDKARCVGSSPTLVFERAVDLGAEGVPPVWLGSGTSSSSAFAPSVRTILPLWWRSLAAMNRSL